jgi:hypothetical protein
MENIDGQPIWVESKTQYFEELNKRGLRMKDQQESTTGPEREIVPEIPAEFLSSPPPDPLTQAEALIFGAMRPFLAKHGITEAMWCNRCEVRKRDSGCRVRVTSTSVAYECRCGKTEYRPPTGTTDTVLAELGGLRFTSADRMTGSISTPVGDVLVPTIALSDVEGSLLVSYFRMMARRELEPRWFCRTCWDGASLSEDDSMAINARSNVIQIICPKHCRMLYWQATRNAIH